MIKKLSLAVALLVFLCVTASAQVSVKEIIFSNSTPVGSNCVDGKLYVNRLTGENVERINGVCTALGGAAGTVTSVTGTANQINVATGTTTPVLTLSSTLIAPGTFTSIGTATFPTPFTLGAVSVLPTGTELNFVDGVTSAIQTQLDAKQATITFGTGVQTALGVNVGSAGAPVLFNGAGGTPSSITLTNGTGLPPTTGISGWPANAAGALTNNGSGTLSWAAAGITNGAGNNVIPKSDGTNLVASGISDDGTTVTTSEAVTQTSASATAFQSGPNGGTNPTLRLVSNTASQDTGVSITGGVAGTLTGATLQPVSSTGNAALIVQSLGNSGLLLNSPSGTIRLQIGGATKGGFISDIFGMTSSMVLGWGAAFNAPDVGLTRSAAGALRVGDGGANASGSILATNSTLSGANSAATYVTATNCSDSAGAASCGAAAAGSFVVDAASTSTVVSTSAVTANSQITLTVDSSLNARLGVTCNTQSSLTLGTPRVTARTAATSFTVTIDAAPTTDPLCIGYKITN